MRFFTILVMILDVAGGLFVPRLTADMIKIGVENGDLNYMLAKGAAMLAVTLNRRGRSACRQLVLCRPFRKAGAGDMRNAVYEKSLELSDHDFEQFGTGSMITTDFK